MTRFYWTGTMWHLDTPIGLSQASVEYAKQFAIKVQTQRYSNLPNGDLREDCGKALKALYDNKIEQVVIGLNKEFVPYDAYDKSIRPMILMPGETK